MYFDSVRSAVPGPRRAQRGMRGPGGRAPSEGRLGGAPGGTGAAPAPALGPRVRQAEPVPRPGHAWGCASTPAAGAAAGAGRGGGRIRDVCKAGRFNPSH